MEQSHKMKTQLKSEDLKKNLNRLQEKWVAAADKQKQSKGTTVDKKEFCPHTAHVFSFALSLPLTRAEYAFSAAGTHRRLVPRQTVLCDTWYNLCQI